MARVTIGTNSGDYKVTSHSGSLHTTINSALDDGHRWLVFLDGDALLDDPVNLDLHGGGSLRLESAGPHIIQLNRGFFPSLNPMFYAYTTGWDLHFTGIMFADFTGSTAAAKPLCEFRNIGGSYFKNCAWVDSKGAGLKLGPTQAAIVTMVAPKFYNNRDYGLFVDNGVALSFLKLVAERNDSDGSQGDQPHVRLRGQSGTAARGCGIIMGTHMERQNTGNPNGLLLERWRAMRVQNGDSLESNIVLASDATDNIVERMSLRGTSVVNNGGSSNKQFGNISANSQGM